MSSKKFRRFPANFTAQEERLYGEVLLPQEIKPPFPAAILCHGMSVDHRAMNPSAERLVKQGIASFIFDFGGHGKSTGIYDSYRVADVIAAFDYLRNHPEVNPRRIGLMGHSIGAITAILAAAELSDVYALVLLSCPPEDFIPRKIGFFLRLPDHEAKGKIVFEYPRDGLLPWLNPFQGSIIWFWTMLRGYRMRINWLKFLEARERSDVLAALKKIKPCPLLWVYCKKDKFASSQASLKLYEEARSPKELLICDSGSHTTPLLPGTVREKWIAWLVSALTSNNYNG